MPFRSEAQRRLLWMKHPEVAREFADKTPKGTKLPMHVAKKKLRGKCALVGKTGSVHEPMALVTMALVGKLGGLKGSGAAPVLNVAPLPDFNDIFYHPEDPGQKKIEEEAEINRRRSMADRNKQKFGLHGVPPPEPILRYAPEDHVLVVRVNANPENMEGANANAIPPPPKVEGRETSGIRFFVRDPYVERRREGAPAPSQMMGKKDGARDATGFTADNKPKGSGIATKTPPGTAKPTPPQSAKLVFREPKPKMVG